tara:strand:+ start:12 stop:380 length:369 start_codon:yes stop_codon:yes gene_type:complete
MRNIKSVKNELIQLLKQNVIEGNYKVIELRTSVAHIIIDGGYKAELWIGNMPDDNFGIWTNELLRCTLDEIAYKTKEERLSAWKVYRLKEKQYKETQEKRDKQKKINSLRKELEELEAEQKK